MSEQPPPLPPTPEQKLEVSATDRFHAAATKAKAWASSLAGRSKAAAQLVAKQAERTKLTRFTLPNVYRALGKHVHDADTFRADFADAYGRIDTFLADIAKLSAAPPAVEGFSEKTKAVAKAAKDKTHAQALQLKVKHAYTELGKAAFDKHGDQSGPAEFITPILDCRARVGSVAAEIADVSKSESGTVLTPKRIAIGGPIIVVLLLLLVAKITLFDGWTDDPARKENVEKANKQIAAKRVQEEAALIDPKNIPDSATALVFIGAKQDYEKYGWNTDLLNATIRSQVLFYKNRCSYEWLKITDSYLVAFESEWKNNRVKAGLPPEKLKSEVR
jgi:hypothetical protein